MDDIHDKVMVYSSAMGKAIEYERKPSPWSSKK